MVNCSQKQGLMKQGWRSHYANEHQHAAIEGVNFHSAAIKFLSRAAARCKCWLLLGEYCRTF